MGSSLVFATRGFANGYDGLECRRLAMAWAARLTPEFVFAAKAELESRQRGPYTREIEAVLGGLCKGKEPSPGYEFPFVTWDIVES